MTTESLVLSPMLASDSTKPAPGETTPEPPVTAGIGLRFVPARLERGANDIVLHGTIVLQPIGRGPSEPSKPSGSSAVKIPVLLKDWPTEIESRLSTLRLQISRVAAQETFETRPVPEPESATAHAVKVRAKRSDIEELTQTWRELMAVNAAWRPLAAALTPPAQCLAGELLRKPEGQPGVPDLLPTGRGDLGHLLTLERGRSLLERLRLAMKYRQSSSPLLSNRQFDENLLTRTAASAAAGESVLPSWLGPSDKEKKAAEELAKERDEAKLKGAESKLAELESRLVNLRLRTVRAKTDAYSKARREYVCEQDPKRFRDRLKALAKAKAIATPPLANANAAAKENPNHVSGPIDRARVLHHAATRPDATQTVNKCATPSCEVEEAKTRFFAIQTQPALSRLFNLAVDVSVSIEKRNFIEDWPAFEDGSRYAFVTATFDGEDQHRSWTVAKLEVPSGSGNGKFFACTREELDARAAGMEIDEILTMSIASQIDGVVDLGAALDDGNVRNPRFDILTLDVQRSTDHDMRLARTTTAAGQAGTLYSGGLQLVDRWRHHQAMTQALGAVEPSGGASSGTILDVEDLTIGYKLDVGLEIGTDGRTGQPMVDWRSLMGREIAFSRGGDSLKPHLDAVLPKDVPAHELNSALLTFPSRVRGNPDAEKPEGVVLPPISGFVEEVIAEWKGPPLGIDLHGSDDLPRHPPQTRQTDCVAGQPNRTGFLQLSQTYSLPKAHAKRPPRLRFGWAYRFGVRPTLAGGVALSLEAAAEIYNKKHSGRFALPPVRQNMTGRRALRHEAIQAPVVATPGAILRRQVPGPQETSLALVLRTRIDPPGVNGHPDAAKDDRRRIMGPKSTHRVVIPPVVALDFADRHGVFDTRAEFERGPAAYASAGKTPDRGLRPRSGLQDVDFDQPQVGGFPIWSTQVTSDGGEYPVRPDASLPKPTGDAIFRPARGPGPSGRRVPYYPDPAADYMVFRIRREDGVDIEGASLVVPLRVAGVAYPDVRPIVIDLVPTDKRSGQPPSQGRVLGLDCGPGKLVRGRAARDAKPRTFRVGEDETLRLQGPGVPVSRVEVLLEPGEAFQLDMWCVPSEDHLYDWFEIVEAAAVVVAASSSEFLACDTAKTFAKQLERFLGMASGTLDKDFTGAPPGQKLGACSAGQLQLPDDAAMAGLTRLLIETAEQGLCPELCARTTLSLTHALDRPYVGPSLELPQQDETSAVPLRLLRVNKPTRDAILKEPAPDALLLWDPARWSGEATMPGGTDVVFGGSIAIDRATTGFVELRAEGPSLLTGTFDDISRGRTEDDRARGIWPEDVSVNAATRKWRSPSEVFGFQVKADGTVALLQEAGILLRLDELDPYPGEPATADPTWANGKPNPLTRGAVQCDLLAEQRRFRRLPPSSGSAEKELEPLRIGATYPDKIADTKARVLRFEVLAGSRSSPLIHDGEGRSLPPGDQTRSSWIEHKDQAQAWVALPASKAPARVSPLTILPAFEWRSQGAQTHGPEVTFQATRVPRLRIRVRRPWFSSGAGERLGIVLWPPEFFDHVSSRPGDTRDDNTALRSYDTEPGREHMNMVGFDDQDLGPGGAFVSRWGGDPTKTRHPESWLIATGAFGDVPQSSNAKRLPWTPLDKDADDVEVVYVPRATMPVPHDEAGAHGSSSQHASATMEVALLAFRPRFNIDQEYWYFDLKLNPHVAVEPFVRLGLVRYQGNAPRALRVSEPVVEWAQLLPQRSVRARVRGRQVTVTVEGHASELPRLRQGHDITEQRHATYGPRMRFEVYRRDASGVESLAETVETEGGRRGIASKESGPEGKGSQSCKWTECFDLLDEPMSSETGTYSVVVSEFELMHPATYRVEPFDPNSPDDELMESGPRFAARIDLHIRPNSQNTLSDPCDIRVHSDISA